MTVTETKTVFGKAADLIEKHGWTIGTPKNFEGCYCVGGAIAEAMTGSAELLHDDKPEELDEALHTFADFVGAERIYDSPSYGPEELESDYRVYNWNDSLKFRPNIDDPKQHVISTLRELDKQEKSNDRD